MQLKSLNKLALIAMCLATPAAYADGWGKSYCNKHTQLHCMYISGLKQGDWDGRYIKEYSPTMKYSNTNCWTSDTSWTIRYSYSAQLLGTNIINYSICPDASGENCEPVGTDTFTVSKVGKIFTSYKADPETYAIDVSAVKDKYPQCNNYDTSRKKTLQQSTYVPPGFLGPELMQR